MNDRLSGLLARFPLRAEVQHPAILQGAARFETTGGRSLLHVLRRGRAELMDERGEITRLEEPTLLFHPRPGTHALRPMDGEAIELLCASIDFGAGDENPLLRGLPPRLSVPLARLPGLDLTLQLLFTEAAAQRCGHDAVTSRLAEALIVQLLRYAIGEQLVDAGLLAGLADPRLARVLNQLHAEPARGWTLERMAAAAGMSRARFAHHFTATLGTSPGDYLTVWRLGLARGLLRQGLAVKQVASEVGYANASALARVFSQRLGRSPSEWRLSPDCAPVARDRPAA